MSIDSFNSPQLAADEKLATVMAYTSSGLCWGSLVIKENVRGSTWLRTNLAPEKICLHNAKYLPITGAGKPSPKSFFEMHIPKEKILVFHLVPPEKDPLDYDQHEANLRFDPVTLLVDKFRVDGKLRLTISSSLASHMSRIQESLTAIYDAEVSCSALPDMGVMRVQYVLVRQSEAIFSSATQSQ